MNTNPRGFIMRAVALLASVAVVLFVGCSDDPSLAQLAQGCSINSDCTDPLACAFGRCHVQCAATRDCPPGSLCVSAGASQVCQLPAEEQCSDTTACPFGLVCAGSTCRNACQSDEQCPVPGQLCSRGACFDVESDGGLSNDGPVGDGPDGAIDGSVTGTGPLGFAPSNFDSNLVVTTSDGGVPSSLTISGACDRTCLPAAQTVHMTNGVDADFFAFQDFTVEQSASLDLTDAASAARPVIIAVAGTADIQGAIRLNAKTTLAGPGGFESVNPGPGKGPAGPNFCGAAGGSYCGVGGAGIGTPGASPVGVTYGAPEIVPLVGGSAGGLGNGDTSGNGGGAGGGALQISARTGLFVRLYGSINAGGGGATANGAGGSGGSILLEASAVTIDGVVAANGGAGTAAGPAPDGLASDQPAIGVVSGGSGGNGSAGASIKGADATHVTVSDQASGGGGAGRIRINTASGAATVTGILSPSLATACATQGKIQ